MQFIVEFEPVLDKHGAYSTDNSNYVTLYEVTKKGRRKYKSTSLTKKSPIKDRVAVICCFLSEGKGLNEICKMYEWTPTTTEFFLWLLNEGTYKSWYQNAINIRNSLVVEKVYSDLAKINSSNDKAIEAIKNCLTKIIAHLNADDPLTDAPVVESPIVKDMRGFYKK